MGNVEFAESDFACADTVEDQFGPFDPSGYVIEPELQGPVPRPIPDALRRGPYARQQLMRLLALMVAAIVCVVGASTPQVRGAGQTILPLAYLDWIGAGLLVLAVIGFLRRLYSLGPYAYVERGTPLVGRICSQVVRCSLITNGQPTMYQFAALVECLDPYSGELLLAEVRSTDFYESKRHELTTSYLVGDYATLVYLPGRPADSLQLYGFLGLRPGIGVIQRTNSETADRRTTLFDIVVALSGFGLVVYGMFSALRYFPLEMPSTIWMPVLAGAAVSVGVGSVLVARYQARAKAKFDQRNADAVAAGEPVEIDGSKHGFSKLTYGLLVSFALALLGVFVGGGLSFCANAWLDQSPPRRIPIEITDREMKTSRFVLRTYTIHYRFLDAKQGHAYDTSLEDIERFPGNSPNAIVREGAFGWPWVERLEPEMPAAAN